MIREASWDEYSLMSNAIMRTEELDYDDLEKAIKLAYRRFYLRPRYILRRASKLNLHNFVNNIKGFKMFIQQIQNKK